MSKYNVPLLYWEAANLADKIIERQVESFGARPCFFFFLWFIGISFVSIRFDSIERTRSGGKLQLLASYLIASRKNAVQLKSLVSASSVFVFRFSFFEWFCTKIHIHAYRQKWMSTEKSLKPETDLSSLAHRDTVNCCFSWCSVAVAAGSTLSENAINSLNINGMVFKMKRTLNSIICMKY